MLLIAPVLPLYAITTNGYSDGAGRGLEYYMGLALLAGLSIAVALLVGLSITVASQRIALQGEM